MKGQGRRRGGEGRGGKGRGGRGRAILLPMKILAAGLDQKDC